MYLAKPALTIHSDKHFERVFIRLGANRTLSCPFRDYDDFEWYKNTERFSGHQSHNITFQNISITDEGKSNKVMGALAVNFNFVFYSSGNFTCYVRNEAGNDMYTYEIVVYSPPILNDAIQNSSNFNVIFAANFSIDCNIFGIPAPKVRQNCFFFFMTTRECFI